MIKVNGYHMIVPRGDTGDVQIGLSGIYNYDADKAIFSVFDSTAGKELITKVLDIQFYTDDYGFTHNYVNVSIKNGDTDYLEAGTYNWDIRVIKNAIYDDKGEIVDGSEVDSVFSHFRVPKFFLKEVTHYV